MVIAKGQSGVEIFVNVTEHPQHRGPWTVGEPKLIEPRFRIGRWIIAKNPGDNMLLHLRFLLSIATEQLELKYTPGIRLFSG
jgi:hypothetical protein